MAALPKYVQVSPDAPVTEWWDPKAEFWFRKKDGIVELPEDVKDPSNIVRYLRFNYLVDATLIKNPPVKPIAEETKLVEKSANQLLGKDKLASLIIDGEKAELPEVKVEDAIPEEIKPEKEECPYCGKEYSLKGIVTHKKACKKNPDNK